MFFHDRLDYPRGLEPRGVSGSRDFRGGGDGQAVAGEHDVSWPATGARHVTYLAEEGAEAVRFLCEQRGHQEGDLPPAERDGSG